MKKVLEIDTGKHDELQVHAAQLLVSVHGVITGQVLGSTQTAIHDDSGMSLGDIDDLRFAAVESVPALKRAGYTAISGAVEAFLNASECERGTLVHDLYSIYGVLSELAGMKLAVADPSRDKSEMYRYVEAPNEHTPNGDTAVFLAGGITGCPNWQQQARLLLHSCDPYLVVVNPRQRDFDLSDPEAGRRQTRWEWTHLHRVEAIIFWFPESEAVQPIALYELGFHLKGDVPIAVGCHPDYPRRQDVVYQLECARPDLQVRSTLIDTINDMVALLPK